VKNRACIEIAFALVLPNAVFGAAPAVTAVVNGSSTIPGGLPNSGVAPSSLFLIQGTGMATPGSVPVLEDSTQGLPLTLNGTRVSVTVNGVTLTPALYYSSPTLVAGVLPAVTPVGTGTITVSYNGTPSAAAPIQVVSSAYGFTTYSGLGVATDALTGALITYTNSAKPGEILVFWGTGLGSDPADSDTTSSPHAINTPVQMYIGGVPVPASSIAYAGASVYPGVDVIGVTVPQGALNGCYSPVAIVTGSGANAVVSNSVTLPIDDNGGSCTDQHPSLTGSQISAYDAQAAVTVGALNIGVLTESGATDGIVLASFYSVAGAEFLDSAATGIVAVGGCTTLEIAPGEVNPVAANETALNAGSVSFQGPSGTIALAQQGFYDARSHGGPSPRAGADGEFHGNGCAAARPRPRRVHSDSYRSQPRTELDESERRGHNHSQPGASGHLDRGRAGIFHFYFRKRIGERRDRQLPMLCAAKRGAIHDTRLHFDDPAGGHRSDRPARPGAYEALPAGNPVQQRNRLLYGLGIDQYQ
jgi:uncharacterized protein (TIGR03437 family)